jgi:hypothetical protein
MSLCHALRSGLPRWFSGAFGGVALLFASTTAPAQDVAQMRELEKKADYILSFTRFVEWPAEKFADPAAPFVIGVFGISDITVLLQEALQKRPAKGRPVVIRHFWNKREFSSCHVLFISRSAQNRLDRIIRHVTGENVLTVGECDDFIPRGGMINFVNVADCVRFQIGAEAAAREKLTISSKLLQLAVPVPRGAPAPSAPSAPASPAPPQSAAAK